MKCTECPEYQECVKRSNLAIKRKSCPKAKVQKQLTNADRIRAMSDEQLASYLVSVESRRRGDGCGAIWGLPYVALDWLKQPAEVE